MPAGQISLRCQYLTTHQPTQNATTKIHNAPQVREFSAYRCCFCIVADDTIPRRLSQHMHKIKKKHQKKKHTRINCFADDYAPTTLPSPPCRERRTRFHAPATKTTTETPALSATITAAPTREEPNAEKSNRSSSVYSSPTHASFHERIYTPCTQTHLLSSPHTLLDVVVASVPVYRERED